MSVKKSLRDATLTNSKYSFTRNFIVGSPQFRANTEWVRNPAWLPMPGFNYVKDSSLSSTLSDTVNDLTLQSDGKILLATSGSSLRLHANGVQDTAFSVGTGFSIPPTSLALQSDGKIVYGGPFPSFNGTSSSAIARLTSTGAIDNSFIIGTGFNDVTSVVVVQPDGKILVGGDFTSYNGTARNRIIRLNSDGSVDTSFVIGSGFDGQVYAIKLQSDGKILVGGNFTSYNGSSNLDYRITRLNPDGSVDRTFITNSGSNVGFNSTVKKIDIQSNGKIVVGGAFSSWQNTITVKNIARLNSDGSLDQTFNIGTGITKGISSSEVKTVFVSSDDYIYVGGDFTEFNGVTRNRIARLNPDGSYDTTFDTGTGYDDTVFSLLIQPDAKLLIGGGFTTYQGSSSSFLNRLTVTEEKIIILQGIKNTANSEVTEFSCAANYTVNWGDGNIINYARDTIASHTYNYFDANLYNTNGNVSFLDSGDFVFRTNHGYANTNTISFANISTTTGITVDTPYYVINANTNYFNLSNTVGGSAVTLTTDGTGFILPYKQVLINVYPQSGNTLTSANLANTSSAVYTSGYSSMFLDIGISAANVTALKFYQDKKKQNTIERVAIFNSNSITNTELLFSSLQALQSVPLFDTSKVTTMTSMFEYCRSLQVVPLFNTANVTAMSSMFSSCASLQLVPLFNTAKVTDMSSMFGSCTSLESVPLFNTANVTSMNSMFSTCVSLQSVPLFNTAKVTTMVYMFGACYALQSVPLFNTAAVNIMQQMFENCYSLQSVPQFNTAAVTNMSYMFVTCLSLQSVPLFNTASVTTMTYMFNNCYSLQSVPLFNTASVTNMSYMFYVCSSLKTVPLFNTAAVTIMSGMFRDCFSLTSVPLFNTASVTDMQQMFLGCYSLKSVPLFNTAAVTNMDLMFYNCYSLQSVPLFDTAAVTTMGQMFLACYSLQSVPKFDTANVTSMILMFFLCYSLKSIPEFNTAKVTNMSDMFYSCSSLQSVPKFNTANVTAMSSMFSGCYSLQSVPEFNTANVTNMSDMFATCPSLQSVPLFNTAKVTNMSGMFYYCLSLKEIPAFECNSVTNFGSMFVSTQLTRSQLANVRYTHGYLNNNLANVELNEIYTNLPTVTSQTITVTGNWGTASDDPTIATAKGWTVTG